MKKIITAFFAFALLSCSSNNAIDYLDDTTPSNVTTELPSTKVTLQTRLGSEVMTLANGDTPLADPSIQDAYFYIRVDNRIPGSKSYPVTDYYPQKDKTGSPREDYNHGTVNVNYIGWSESATVPKKYIYDTTGKMSVKPLKSEPDLENMLDKSNVKLSKDLVNADTLKIIWYITKFESGFWHVDGVLTGESTKDITEVPGIDEDTSKDNKKEDTVVPEGTLTDSIEVDIHQQEHQTWDEIKTSVHIRDLVDSIKITIPIKSEYVCESDDMAIRYYEYFGKVDSSSVDSSSYTQVIVKHTDNSINITIKVNPNYVKELIDKDGDGLTVEIHNYIKDLTDKELFDLIKTSEVVTYKKTKVTGQITSAFFEDKEIFK